MKSNIYDKCYLMNEGLIVKRIFYPFSPNI